MADIHVLTGRKSTWDLVLHIAVPDADNSVGVNYRDALIASGLGGTTSLPDGDGSAGTISDAEKILIEAGQIVEHRVSIRLESGGDSDANRRDAIRAKYASEEVSYLAIIQKHLPYYGHTEAKE